MVRSFVSPRANTVKRSDLSRIFSTFVSPRHAGEMMSLGNELESLKELLHTYEQSIQRKDDVISNLTGAMGKQRDKFDTLKTFCEWKIKHNDVKREVSNFLLALGMNSILGYIKRTFNEIFDSWLSFFISSESPNLKCYPWSEKSAIPNDVWKCCFQSPAAFIPEQVNCCE